MRMKLGRLLLVATLPACLSVPDKEAPRCATTSDCDAANGEICDDGVCWGNPPAGPFAAVVSPPSERSNLSSREILELPIAQDGWIDQIQLDKPVIYSAQLACQAPLMCDNTLLNATITVTRASNIPGGPAFRSVVKVKGTEPFQLAVPPGHEATAYTITVLPDGRDDMSGLNTPAQVLPPLRTQLTIDGNASGKVIELGGIALPTITGVVKSDLDQPQQSYRVVAIGRWDSASAPTEVSTVDFTGTDGSFSIQLSGGLLGPVELVAKPVGTSTAQTVRPTLHVANVSSTSGVQNVEMVWPPNAGTKLDLDIPVEGVDGNGELKPARGARVVVSSSTLEGDATFVAESTTDDNGRAKLAILDGQAFASAYRISIIPPPDATVGVMYDEAFSILGPIPKKRLPTRVALRGVVYLDGSPVKDMSVTARPSLRFVWSLDPAPQAFLTAVPPSSAVTPESGEFVLWVDSHLVDTWGYYDLALEAASGSRAPSLTVSSIELPRSASQAEVTLPVIDLPKPAYVRSTIVDDKGTLLEGAELKLYKTEDFGALCMIVKNPPASCTAPATLISRGASDEDGLVRLTLPRMAPAP